MTANHYGDTLHEELEALARTAGVEITDPDPAFVAVVDRLDAAHRDHEQEQQA